MLVSDVHLESITPVRPPRAAGDRGLSVKSDPTIDSVTDPVAGQLVTSTLLGPAPSKLIAPSSVPRD